MLSVTSLLSREYTVRSHVDDLSVCTLCGLCQKMREITIQECSQSMIILSELVKYANTVNHSVVVSILNDSSYGLSIKSVTSKTLNEFAFLKVKAIDFVALFLKVKANGMACHTVATTYKESHIASSFNYSER